MPDDFDPETDHLSVEQTESGLVVVTLNYPERRNAMSGPMTAAWGRLAAALRSTLRSGPLSLPVPVPLSVPAATQAGSVEIQMPRLTNCERR